MKKYLCLLLVLISCNPTTELREGFKRDIDREKIITVNYYVSVSGDTIKGRIGYSVMWVEDKHGNIKLLAK